MFTFLHDRALVASADGTADCVHRQWFLEVFLGPFSNVNDRIMPMSDAVFWGPEDHEQPTKVFGIVPYAEISPVSLNLLMMLCTVDEICKAFAICRWGTMFLKYSTIFLRTLSQIVEPLPIFTPERLCLSKAKFTWLYTSADRCALQTTWLDCLSFSQFWCSHYMTPCKGSATRVTHYRAETTLSPNTRFGP